MYRGDPGAVWKVGLGFVSRAAVIGLGLAMVGGDRKYLVRDALAGSAAVELFVLAWVWRTSPEAWAQRPR
jgi:hypothetical protein